MMDVWTGYYAQMKKYQKAGLIPVSIAYLTPVWYMGETLFEVAPPRKILKGWKDKTLTWEQYTEQYNEFLRKEVKWKEVINKMFDISEKYDGADLVLCCYEKPEDNCHRHLLADFLNKNGMDIEEYPIIK